MDSIKRIYLACRATIAELAPNTYFISTGVLLVSGTLMYLGNSDSDSYGGILGADYFNLDPRLTASLVIGFGWLAATIISGTIVNKYFKEENRAIRYLSLPLSNGERYATLLLINGVFVSIVSFLPMILLAILVYFLRPDSLLMPWPGFYWGWLLIGPLVHILTMAFWLFPTIAYANKAWYAIIGTIATTIFYLSKTRSSDFIDLEYTTTAFEATDVVGLSQYQFLEKEVTEISYKIPDQETLYLAFAAIVSILMLFSAYLALTRKTA